MSTMTTAQMRFVDLVASLKDSAGSPVDPATITDQAFVSSDPTIVTMELRAADGSPDAAGKMAEVAQAVGVSTITFTGKNPSGTTVTLTDVATITAAPSSDAVDGPLVVGDPMAKPVVAGARRR